MNQGTPYKSIIFDLGRVLVNFDFQRGYRALEGLCPYPAAEIPMRIPIVLVRRLETGLIEPRDFYLEFSHALGLTVDYSRFCEIWCSIFTELLLPESLLESLAARYRLVLLSNTNPIHFEQIRASFPQMLRHFHHLVLSYEVMAMKPQPEIYRAAIAAAQCRPEECFFTDDILEYVEAAKALGIDAVQFESREQIVGELQARGIAIAGD
jgi:FMN phosphatase YigB (HAD superfamily)